MIISSMEKLIMKKKNEVESEETKDVTPTEKSNPNIIVLSKEEPEKPFDEEIEEGRKNIFKVYKSTTTRNNIIMAVVVAIFVGAFIAITRGQIGQIIGWVLVGVTVAGLVIYYLLTRNLYPNTSKKYFSTFWKASNNYLFNQPKFEDCQIDTTEKYQLADIVADRVYKDAVDIASRNIVRGKYDGKPFAFGELALYKAGIKKRSREVIFVGRHLALENDFVINGRYVVSIKRADKAYDLANDVDDLVPLIENNLFTVYGLEGANPEKDLGKELLNNLKAIECSGALLSVNIVFWHKRTSCYLSYDDSIVAIPFEQPINPDAYVSLKKNIGDIFEILEGK